MNLISPLFYGKKNRPDNQFSLADGANHNRNRTTTMTRNYLDHASSSGKRKTKALDYTGEKFQDWEVIRFVGFRDGRPVPEWLCRCKCGVEHIICIWNAISGKSKGCRECGKKRVSVANKTHGLSKGRTYRIWRGAKKRAGLKSDPAYARYGAVGKTMCERFSSSFEDFLMDLGECPKGLSLERIENKQGYNCGKCRDCLLRGVAPNCKWATRKEQCRNKSTNAVWHHDGKSHCITEWSEITGIRKDTLRRRVVVLGWPIAKALSKNVQPRNLRRES